MAISKLANLGLGKAVITCTALAAIMYVFLKYCFIAMYRALLRVVWWNLMMATVKLSQKASTGLAGVICGRLTADTLLYRVDFLHSEITLRRWILMM